MYYIVFINKKDSRISCISEQNTHKVLSDVLRRLGEIMKSSWGFTAAFIFFSIFLTIFYFLMTKIDEIFFVISVFSGFYQWLYVIPLVSILKEKPKYKEFAKGFLVGAIVITLLNIALIIWMFVEPSRFF